MDHYHANFAERQIGGVDIQTKQGIMRETHHTNCKQDGQWQFYCEKTISSTFYLRAPGEIVNFQVKTYPEHLGDKISQETPSNLAGTTIHVDEYAWLTAPSLPYTAEELEQNPVLSLNQ